MDCTKKQFDLFMCLFASVRVQDKKVAKAEKSAFVYKEFATVLIVS